MSVRKIFNASAGYTASIASSTATGYDANYADVSLLLNGNGTNGSKTFTDLSSSNNAITANGTSKIDTSTKMYGTGSMFFAGAGDYLTYQDSVGLGSNDFTVEFWYNAPTGFANYYSGIINIGSTVNVNMSGLVVCDNLYVYLSNDGATYQYAYTCGTPVNNTWTHLALVRKGSDFYVFNNGVQLSKNTISGSLVNGAGTVIIGKKSNSLNTSVPSLYIDDLRITKGVARYTASFTPPTYQLPTDTTGTVIDPLRSSTSLLLRGNGTNGSTSFTDESPNGLTVTNNGSVTVNTTTKKYGTGSMTFSSSKYLSIPTTSAVQFGTADFTVEFWYCYTSSSSVFGHCILDTRISGAATGTSFLITNTGGVQVWGGSQIANSGTSPINTWNHYAFVRTSGTLIGYINGVQVFSTAYTQNLTDTACLIGTNQPINTFAIGYLDDFRITKGLARYTSNFTPPTYEDPIVTGTVYDYNYPQVSLLLNGDGTNGSTVFKDLSSSPKTITNNGSVTVNTTTKKYGTGSMYFSGTNTLSTSSIILGTNNFTIEFWFNQTSQMPYSHLFSTTASYGTTNGLRVTTGGLNLTVYTAGTALIQPAVAISNSTWYHFALVRSGTTLTLYQNGVSIGTTTTSISFTSDTFMVGGDTSYPYNGHIDDFRVTNGIARYTANFTPPTAPLPTSYS